MDNRTDNTTCDWFAMCTDKEQIFVNDLAAHGVKRQAAIAAGFDAKNASNAAFRMLKRERVSNALAQRRAELDGQTDTGPEPIRRELWLNYQRAVAAGNVAAANRALELLGKANGMFTDTLELTGKDGAPLASPEVTDAELARRMAVVLRNGEREALADREEPGTSHPADIEPAATH